jgi:hypothetical protein
MKVIIAGGRDYIFTEFDKAALNALLVDVPITEVVSGCAPGADTCGEQWAISKNIPIKKFPADWKKYGKSAGYKRNKQMAEYANVAVLFPGGKGTDLMFSLAKEKNLKIYDFRNKL